MLQLGPKYCLKLVRLGYFSSLYQEIATVWLNLTNQQCWAFQNENCNKIRKWSYPHFDTNPSLLQKSVISTKSITSTEICHWDRNPSVRHVTSTSVTLTSHSARHFDENPSFREKFEVFVCVSDTTKDVEVTNLCRQWRICVEVTNFCCQWRIWVKVTYLCRSDEFWGMERNGTCVEVTCPSDGRVKVRVTQF